jgi:glucosyl-3-phosphoglycerate synthase
MPPALTTSPSTLAATTQAGRDGKAPRLFHYGEFVAAELLAAKRVASARVHVVIPARDEEETIGAIVAAVRRDLVDAVPLVDDLVVVDDASGDRTAELAAREGATVVTGPGLGKGEAMACGAATVEPSQSSIVVWLDGDVRDFGSGYVTGLLGPLFACPEVLLVKGRYRRPIGDQATGGGRVTELVAKPALRLFFPELAAIDQPLAGETAVRGCLLHDLELEGGYAVEVALLVDAYRRYGVGALAEVDLGERRHRNRSLADLVPEADTVLRTVLGRAGVAALARPPAEPDGGSAGSALLGGGAG